MTYRRCSLAVVLAVGICTGAVGQDAEQEKPTELEVKGRGPKTFYANSRAGNSQVTFFSESALEDFTGVCNRIGGQCTVDPQHIESFAGRFYLRLKDLDTGIDLRNQHMLEPDWFDAAKYPEVVIEIKGVNGSFTRDNVNQVDSHRERLKLPPNTPGLLIMNTKMTAESLGDKDEAPHADIIQKAVQDNVLLIRTLDLLRIADLVESETIAKDEFRSTIIGKSGWLRTDNGVPTVVTE